MKNSFPFFIMIVLLWAQALRSDAATRYAKSNGNWNSNTTWTSTANGTTSASYPVAGDVVVIARNREVTVNISNAACASVQIGSNASVGGGAGFLTFKAASRLTVSGAVTLGGSSTSWLQLGSVNMTEGGVLACASISSVSPNDQWIPGKGTLELTAANTLPAAKITTFNHLTINGGTTTLGTSITVNGTLTLTKGSLISAAVKMLTLGADALVSGGSDASFVAGPMRQTWKTATAAKVFPLGKTSYQPITISLTTPSCPMIQAECFNAAITGTLASPLTVLSTSHYYQASLITGSASKGGSVTIPNFDLATTASNLAVAQSASLSGIFTRLSGNSGTSSLVTATGYNPAAAAVLVVGSTDAAMPVELTSFTATTSRGGILLNWSTATETNNAGFEVERRSASGEWQRLGFVEGSGSSNTQHQYSYRDAGVPAGSYAYRLKQIDRDGAYEYSGEVEAAAAPAPGDYTITQNYPNPFNPTTMIRFAVPVTQNAEVKVFNLLGQHVRTLFSGMAEGGVMHSVQFDASGLPSGMYLYRLITAERTEVKRMLLVR